MTGWRKRIITNKKDSEMKIAYCDYIAHIIRENLLINDDESMIDEVGKIQYHLDDEGAFASTMKTIDVLDMQGKQYRITVQEL